MVETFKEREVAKPTETKLVPTIQREEREFHGPIDTLSRSANNLRIPHELTRAGGPKAVARVDMDMRVAGNVSQLRLEGSTPLQERFTHLLESIKG